jgi:hypothetical protein
VRCFWLQLATVVVAGAVAYVGFSSSAELSTMNALAGALGIGGLFGLAARLVCDRRGRRAKRPSP